MLQYRMKQASLDALNRACEMTVKYNEQGHFQQILPTIHTRFAKGMYLLWGSNFLVILPSRVTRVRIPDVAAEIMQSSFCDDPQAIGYIIPEYVSEDMACLYAPLDLCQENRFLRAMTNDFQSMTDVEFVKASGGRRSKHVSAD